MITIGRLAETYGMLPSEVASRATSYDMMIFDIYETHKRAATAKANNTFDPSLYDQDPEKLKAIMEAAREQH